MRNRPDGITPGVSNSSPKTKKDRFPQARQGRGRRLLRLVIMQAAQDRPGALRLLATEQCCEATIRKEVTKILWLKN